MSVDGRQRAGARAAPPMDGIGSPGKICAFPQPYIWFYVSLVHCTNIPSIGGATLAPALLVATIHPSLSSARATGNGLLMFP